MARRAPKPAPVSAPQRPRPLPVKYRFTDWASI